MRLTREDSGTADAPVTWAAYPGEFPVLSGGQRIEGWTPRGDGIYCTRLDVASAGRWKSRELFYNGARLRRARYPKARGDDPRHSGFLKAGPVDEDRSCDAITFDPSQFPHAWSKPWNGEVYVRPGGFWGEFLAVDEIRETEAGLVSMRLRHPVMICNIPPWYFKRWKLWEGSNFFVENMREDLTEPGEWCVDFDDGMLCLIPPDGDIDSADIIAPCLQTLVRLDDVKHVHLRGLTFRHTLGGDNYNRHQCEGYGAMMPQPGRPYVGEALYMRDAEHCVIEDNVFDHVGGNAIYLYQHNARNLIRRNEITHAGAHGIGLFGTREQHPFANVIEDNHIHHVGAITNYCAGVSLGVSDANKIAHNHIHDTPHHGLNLGTNGFGRNIVEYNLFENNCLENNDLGAINSWMDCPELHPEPTEPRSGHIIRFNRIRDCGHQTDKLEGGMGVYLDDYSSNCLVQGNLIERCTIGVMIHGGQHNSVDNNVLIDCRVQVAFGNACTYRPGNQRMKGFVRGNAFTRNLCYSGGEPFIAVRIHIYHEGDEELVGAVIGPSGSNVYGHAAGVEPEFQIDQGVDADHGDGIRQTCRLQEWQELGFDRESVLADPGFIDVEAGDYRLKNDSPAHGRGIDGPDLPSFGVRHHADYAATSSRPLNMSS